MCVYKKHSKNCVSTYVMREDEIFFPLFLGYIGSICMLNAPKASTDKNMQEAIASILIACLVVGTGTGSFLSLPIVKSF